MKTANDIKVILYDESERYKGITADFLKLKKPIFIAFNNNKELTSHLKILRNRGYNSKEVVILKPFKGSFFELCPGSPGVICCNYRIINTCFNCIYNCTYCFLNSYLNSFGIHQFTNLDEIYKEIDLFLKNMDTGHIYRIGSGEFTDSLMMDEITGLGEKLIKKFSLTRNVMFELKSKSDNINHLLTIKDKGNTVLAWSLNTKRNISQYEQDTASLNERLKAAKMASEVNYFLAFHFDPIIIYNGWEQDYKELIKELFRNVDPEKVVWISMGCFRYSPAFKEILRDKFPEEELTIQEMFPGIDGKYRYLKNKRIDIYKTIIGYIHDFTSKPFIYLCMETKDIWNSVFNMYYDSSDLFEKDFSEYLKSTFLNKRFY